MERRRSHGPLAAEVAAAESPRGNGSVAPSNVADDVEEGAPQVVGAPQDASPSTFQLVEPTRVSCWRRCCNKGDLSNLATFVVMLVGIALSQTLGADHPLSSYVLALGLFGFAGGVTNWLAVKMLFDRVPLLYGSGVVPRNFKEIIGSVKAMIMKLFFDGDYLRQYLTQRGSNALAEVDFEAKIKAAMEGPDVEPRIARVLQGVATGGTQEAMMVKMMLDMFGGSAPPSPDAPSPGAVALAPMVKPVMVGLGVEMVRILLKDFDVSEVVGIDKVREELDLLMEQKLRIITPEMVKQLLEAVIREHLGWLVVWGNVFGGLIGVVAKAAGYG